MLVNAQVHSLTERLAQHLQRPIPMETRDRARLHLLDWLGCVAGALKTEVAARVRKLDDPAVVRAAWLGNVLEMDDVHRSSILHPGPVVWPAVIAAAPAMPAALEAAVRGYDATISVGETFDGFHYLRWHNTATAGAFGAAAATASLLGADADATVSALGLAGSVTGGLWRTRHEPVMAKQWHVAHAMATGAAAARAASVGVSGPRFILEGEQGLYAAMTAEPKPLSFVDRWRIFEVSFKPWGACRHAHPAIDAALELKEAGALHGEVLVETYSDALAFCDRPVPVDTAGAKFSLQHAVAIVAERGEPALGDFEPNAIASLEDARTRVSVRESADFSGRFPVHYGARVTAGGKTIERIDTLGDPERPLSSDRLVSKARALMDWGGVGADADEAVSACLEGEDVGRVRTILERWL